jgi:hypothetical protein
MIDNVIRKALDAILFIGVMGSILTGHWPWAIIVSGVYLVVCAAHGICLGLKSGLKS